MIIGLGEDMVDISRIEKIIREKGDAFIEKCFTSSEQEQAQLIKRDDQSIAFFAKRYAAKEACLKALGTGMREGLSWKDICISKDDLGRPHIHLSGGAAKRAQDIAENKEYRIHLTLCDEANFAKATVIIDI